jgi:hypothetical protein
MTLRPECDPVVASGSDRGNNEGKCISDDSKWLMIYGWMTYGKANGGQMASLVDLPGTKR